MINGDNTNRLNLDYVEMEWATVQHLDLRHIGRGVKPLQPHAAAFHPHQAIVAAAIGTYIVGKHRLFSLYYSFGNCPFNMQLPRLLWSLIFWSSDINIELYNEGICCYAD